MESLQSVGECLNRINSKHDALVALIEIMSKHKIIFGAARETDTERGEISVFRIMCDFFDDGEPITIFEKKGDCSVETNYVDLSRS